LIKFTLINAECHSALSLRLPPTSCAFARVHGHADVSVRGIAIFVLERISLAGEVKTKAVFFAVRIVRLTLCPPSNEAHKNQLLHNISEGILGSFWQKLLCPCECKISLATLVSARSPEHTGFNGLLVFCNEKYCITQI
jgi:hypothetical protein